MFRSVHLPINPEPALLSPAQVLRYHTVGTIDCCIVDERRGARLSQCSPYNTPRTSPSLLHIGSCFQAILQGALNAVILYQTRRSCMTTAVTYCRKHRLLCYQTRENAMGCPILVYNANRKCKELLVFILIPTRFNDYPDRMVLIRFSASKSPIWCSWNRPLAPLVSSTWT